MYSSTNVIRTIISRRVTWAVHEYSGGDEKFVFLLLGLWGREF
jgi:hypothetical protein